MASLPKDIMYLMDKLFDKDVPSVRPQAMGGQRGIKLGYPLLFAYDAKWKSKLEYWDALPLTIPIARYPDGFLGISLHYIPWAKRINLCERLVRATKNKNRIKYIDIKRAWLSAKLPMALSYLCIRRYLYSHIRSEVKQFDWETYRVAVKNIQPKFQKQGYQNVLNIIAGKYKDHTKKKNLKPKWTNVKKKK